MRFSLTVVLACLPVAFCLSGCDKPRDQRSFVARVGSSVLSDDDLPGGPQARADSSAPALRYINQWVSSELLYQEALRRELDKEEGFSSQLAAVRKRLLIEALLEDVLYVDSSDVPEEAIGAYFAAHESELVLTEDVALVSYAGFDDRAAGNRFRSGIVRGSSWEKAVEDLYTDTLLVPHLRQMAHREYVTRSTLFPEELWKIARTMSPPRVSFVVTTESGYYVLYLHDYRRQGSSPDLPYVAAEIHGRLTIERKRVRYEELLGELRARFPVEVRFGNRDETTGM